jgi:hypothetical protein
MRLFVSLTLLAFSSSGLAQSPVPLDSLLPVRSFCIAAPKSDELKDFLVFMDKELATNSVIL